MSPTAASPASGLISTLRRMAQPQEVEEQCDFCHASLGAAHRHLKEMANRRIICACDPCSMLFQHTVGGRFRLIPRDSIFLADFKMTDAQWENFHLPINLTFFYRDTAAKKVMAMYPSAAGVTESLLPAENWDALEAGNPALAQLQPDVEALLVNRVGGARDYFITPIDVCYELAGLIRMHWRGFSGGDKVWEQIDNFFAALREKARTPASTGGEAVHA